MKSGNFPTTLLLAAACWLPQAHAQTAYKYVFPDGRIVYSDKPVPGARLESQIDVPPPPDLSTPAVRGGVAAPASGEPKKTLEQAWEELRRATARLEQAKAAAGAGVEPLEGERTGTAGGGSRLNDAYWQRQKDNEAAVAKAEADVKEAQDLVNSLR